MATSGNKSGSFNGTYPSYATPIVYWSYTQKIPENQTTVTATLKVKRNKTGSSTTKSSTPWSITIAGTKTSGTKSFNITSVSAGGEITIGSATKTITHKADGTYGSVSFSAEIDLSGTTLGKGTVSGSFTPTTIPRTSPVSLSSTNFTVGDTITIYTNRKSSSFSHTARIKCGNYDVTVTIDVNNSSYKWATSVLYEYITTSNSKSGTVTLTTKSGSTTIGTSEVAFTANIRNANPSIESYNWNDGNSKTVALTGSTESNQIIVKGYSSIKVKNIVYSLKSFVTLSRIELNVGSQKVISTDSSSQVEIEIPNVYESIGTISVIDSRTNISSSNFSAKTFLEYFPVNLTSITAKRLDHHGGSENPTGTATSLSFDGEFWNKNFGKQQNALLSAKYYYKLTSEEDSAYRGETSILNSITKSSDSDGISLDSLDIKGDITSDTRDEDGNWIYYGFQANESYDIKIVLEDRLDKKEFVVTLPTGKPDIKIYKDSEDVTVYDFQSPLLQNGNPVYQEDTGWINATLSSNFKPYSDDSENIPQYRKIGKIVKIRGCVAPKSEIASGGSATIFTLPEGYRPAKGNYFICQGSGRSIWLLTVASDGTVAFSRYGTSAYASAGTGVWLPFDAIYLID